MARPNQPPSFYIETAWGYGKMKTWVEAEPYWGWTVVSVPANVPPMEYRRTVHVGGVAQHVAFKVEPGERWEVTATSIKKLGDVALCQVA